MRYRFMTPANKRRYTLSISHRETVEDKLKFISEKIAEQKVMFRSYKAKLNDVKQRVPDMTKYTLLVKCMDGMREYHTKMRLAAEKLHWLRMKQTELRESITHEVQ